MSADWFAPHAAGFGPLVARLVARDIPSSIQRRAEDNALIFSSETMPRAVLAYCRGLFRLIGEAPGGLESAARELARDPDIPERIASGPRIASSRGPRSFVLRAFKPDDPASLPRGPRAALEEMIALRTGARPDSERPDCEYRLQERADGTTLFLERITQTPEPPTRPGELPKTTCRLLAEMTDPRPDDVFLDPFCGYGGIALERALAAPYRFVFASDIDPEKAASVKVSLSAHIFERRRKTIFPKARDALDGAAFEAGFVTAIATDPPWGLYEGGPGLERAEALQRGFLTEAERLLAPGGRLVLLASRGAELEAGASFAQREAFDVLVSGKKAKALRLDRI